MEIDEDSYLFWTILEANMHTKVKNYIKNTLRYLLQLFEDRI